MSKGESGPEVADWNLFWLFGEAFLARGEARLKLLNDFVPTNFPRDRTTICEQQ